MWKRVAGNAGLSPVHEEEGGNMAAKAAKPKKSPMPKSGARLSLGFGLMTVPVSMKLLHETTKPIPGKGLCPVHASQFGATLSTKTVCGAGCEHEHELDTGEKATGYLHPDDKSRYVIVDQEWLKSLEEEKTGTAQIEAVIDPDTLDPVYLGQVFLVWAQEGGEALFDLLCELLRTEGKAAVVSTVRAKQTQMIAFRWSNELGCLVGQVVRYSNELRYADVDLVTAAAADRGTKVDKTMLGLAKQLLETLGADEFDAGEVKDEWTPVLEEAIRRSDDGSVIEITVPNAVPTAGPTDLLAALQASVAAAPAKTAAKKKAPARKPKAVA